MMCRSKSIYSAHFEQRNTNRLAYLQESGIGLLDNTLLLLPSPPFTSSLLSNIYFSRESLPSPTYYILVICHCDVYLHSDCVLGFARRLFSRPWGLFFGLEFCYSNAYSLTSFPHGGGSLAQSYLCQSDSSTYRRPKSLVQTLYSHRQVISPYERTRTSRSYVRGTTELL